MDTKLISDKIFAAQQKFGKTNTPPGGLGNDMGTTSKIPPTPSGSLRPGQRWSVSPPAVGATCSIFKTEQGEYVVAGDENLLRDYFENNPEQWLRVAALMGEEK